MKWYSDALENNKKNLKKVICVQIIVIVVLSVLTLSKSHDIQLFLITIGIFGSMQIYVDIIFYRRKIKGLIALEDVESIRCVIYDFLNRLERQGKGTAYKVYPVFKDINTGKLYITFSPYNVTTIGVLKRKFNDGIYDVRRDMLPARVGSRVDIYVESFIDSKVVQKEKYVLINRSRFLFINEKKDFREIQIFKGGVNFDV